MPQLLHDRRGAPDAPAQEPTQDPTKDAATTSAVAAAMATVVVEASTAEEALAVVHRNHGTGARIIQAEKVLRGGVGGFFTKELVQLTVEPVMKQDTALSPVEQALADAAADDGGPMDETFGEMLDRRAGAARDATPDAPTSVRGSALGAVSAERVAGSEDYDEPLFSQPSAASTPPADSPVAGPPNRGLAGVVADLAAVTDHRESTFGDALRAAMVPEVVEAGAAADSASTAAAGTATLIRDVTTTATAGAAALAEQAPKVAPATVGMEQAEVQLDAAIRAVTAGTTAATVVRAAEQGVRTGYVAPQQLSEVTRGTDEGRARLHDLIARTSEAVAATKEEARIASIPVQPDAPTSATAIDVPGPDSITADAGPWSQDALRRLGLPEEIMRAVAMQRPTDDLGWFSAMTRALQPLCRELPAGSDMIVGAYARRYGRAAEVELVTLDQHAPRRGPAAIAMKLNEHSRRWLAREAGGRWLHLVIGGSGWREFLFERPSVISWTSIEDLPQAITAAAQLDLILGFGIEDASPVRARAVDLAIALRGMLEQR
ncbi:MAG: hypothetical protein ACI9OB_000324 [Nonlabens sp.]|jgi:hypothetical protein